MSHAPLVLPALSGNRVHLREWRDTDVGIVQEASHDPLIPAVTTVPRTAGEAEALAFIGRQHDRLHSHAGYAFAITDHDDLAVGHIGLFFLESAGTRASVGYWIGSSHRRRGYAGDALAALTSWAVRLDGLDRLELYVEPWNEGSWRAAEQAGYEREGLLRAWQRVDSQPRDMYMYSRLNEAASIAADSGNSGCR
jgi:ribosomal-protein-alanine N-acetyltransferase